MTMIQTAMITGANSGIGLELTKLLLSKGWNVIALIRSEFPAEEAAIRQAHVSFNLYTYKADLSDLKSLKNALNQIKAKHDHIDVLFNNAGVSLDHFEKLSTDRDIHFEVNTLAPYILSQEMKPLLRKGQHKKIINTSSNALLHVKQFDLAKLLRPDQRFKKLFGIYAESKLALSLWSSELAISFSKEGLDIMTVDPGGNKTAMTAGSGMPKWLLMIRNLFFAHPSKGAALLLHAALENSKIKPGSFMSKGKEIKLPHAQNASFVLEQVDQIYKREYNLRT